MGNKKRILVLSYYHLSPTEVGALRPRAFVRSLLDEGCSVDVLCRYESDVQQPLEPGLRYICVKERKDPFNFLWHLLKKLRYLKKSEQQQTQNELFKSLRDEESFDKTVSEMPFLKRIVQRCKRWYLSFDAMYSGIKYWCFLSILKLIGLRLIGRNYDIVVSSSPPDALNLISIFCKKIFGAVWICDMRDPFYRFENSPIMKRSDLRTFFEKFLIRSTLKNSNFITVTTPNYLKVVSEMLPLNAKSKAHLIFNGYDTDYWGIKKKGQNELNITYAGILYNFRSPFEFLESLKVINEECIAEGLNLQVNFFGDCNEFNGVDLIDWVKKEKLEGVVKFLGKIPRESLHQYYLEADILLILAQNQPIQLPGKTFEYLAYDGQILGIAEKDSITSQFIRNNNVGYCVEPKVDEIISELRACIARRQNAPNESLNYNKGLFKRSLQNEKLIKLTAD